MTPPGANGLDIMMIFQAGILVTCLEISLGDFANYPGALGPAFQQRQTLKHPRKSFHFSADVYMKFGMYVTFLHGRLPMFVNFFL